MRSPHSGKLSLIDLISSPNSSSETLVNLSLPNSYPASFRRLQRLVLEMQRVKAIRVHEKRHCPKKFNLHKINDQPWPPD